MTIALEPEQDTSTHVDRPPLAHLVHDKGQTVDALVFGTPVTALCGRVWVPSRDPQGLPVCQACREAYEALYGPLGDDIT